MQEARDFSLPIFSRFYPSFEQSRQTHTHDYRIGVFYDPYDPLLQRKYRGPIKQWNYWRQLEEEAKTPFRSSARSYAHNSNYNRDPQATPEFNDQPRRDYVQLTRFSEFHNYERTYGNFRNTRWNLRGLPATRPLLKRLQAIVATPKSNPRAFVNQVLDEFAEFYDPDDRLTREDLIVEVDLLGSVIQSNYSQEMIGSILNARRRRLEEGQVAGNMRWLAEKVLEWKVLEAQTANALGLDDTEYDKRLELALAPIEAGLEVRRKLLLTGDIQPNDEYLAGIDSKQDEDEDVDEEPEEFNFKLKPEDVLRPDILLQKLKRVTNVGLTGVPNELDLAILEKRELERRGQPTAAIARQIAHLRVSKKLVETQEHAKVVVGETERGNAAILVRRQRLDQLQQIAADAAKRVNDTAVALTAAKIAKQDTTDLERAFRDREKEFEDRVDENLTVEHGIVQDEDDINRNLYAEALAVAQKIHEGRGIANLKQFLPKGGASTDIALYERAVSLVTADLVEEELKALRFPNEARMAEAQRKWALLGAYDDATELKKEYEDAQQSAVTAQHGNKVREAVQLIEMTRVQLPRDSLVELALFAGRGTLPFALASSSSVLSVDSVSKDYKPHRQTQEAIRDIVRV